MELVRVPVRDFAEFIAGFPLLDHAIFTNRLNDVCTALKDGHPSGFVLFPAPFQRYFVPHMIKEGPFEFTITEAYWLYSVVYPYVYLKVMGRRLPSDVNVAVYDFNGSRIDTSELRPPVWVDELNRH